MIDKADAERIAQAVHDLRPEWPAQSVLTLIGNSEDLRTRAYRDLAVAFAYVAADSSSLTPGRVREQGPWWAHTNAQRATVSAVTTHCGDHPEHAALHCPECAEEVLTDPDVIAARAAEVRAAIPRRERRNRPTAPTPPPTSLADTRARADAQEA